MSNIPPPTFYELVFTEPTNNHVGRDVYRTALRHPKAFWLETGETVESFNELLEFIRPALHADEREDLEERRRSKEDSG